MDIKFTDSFWKSLKTLSRHQTWWYKIYEFFRRDLPYFFENIWFFRKELYKFRSWDYSYNLNLLRRSLEKTVNTIEFHGHEVDNSRMKKVEKIKRAIQLLNNIISDKYISQSENELGEIKDIDWEFIETGITTDNTLGEKNEKLYELVENGNDEDNEHNGKVFQRAKEIEKLEWKELLTIFEGQDHEEYISLYNSLTEEEKMEKDLWYEWFDGSGMKQWWD